MTELDPLLDLSPAEEVIRLDPSQRDANWGTSALLLFGGRRLQSGSSPLPPLTVQADRTALSRAPESGPLAQQRFVLPLLKSRRNPFTNLIAVGRAKNNDVVLRSGLVSNLHCILIEFGTGWRLCNRAPSNGTSLNGVYLEDYMERELASNDLLRFGDVECVFMRPGDLTPWLP